MDWSLRTALLALAVTAAAPGPAHAWGVPGCVNLPEYNRALGALQGMTSACDMSVERAREVVAEHDGVPLAVQRPAPPPPLARRPRVRRIHRRHGAVTRAPGERARAADYSRKSSPR